MESFVGGFCVEAWLRMMDQKLDRVWNYREKSTFYISRVSTAAYADNHSCRRTACA